MGALGTYLTRKWNERFADNAVWTMWDLALIEALVHPELAHEIEVDTPPENKRRKVWVYDAIQTEAMQKNYWKAVNAAASH